MTKRTVKRSLVATLCLQTVIGLAFVTALVAAPNSAEAYCTTYRSCYWSYGRRYCRYRRRCYGYRTRRCYNYRRCYTRRYCSWRYGSRYCYYRRYCRPYTRCY